MKNRVYTMLAVFCFSILLAGCAKKEGCTDKNATNYQSDAETDCHCCKYKGQLVFWYGKNTATALMNQNSTALTYYVDNKIVGSGASSVYWTGAPNCGQASSVTIEMDLGEAKSHAYEYKIVDQDGDVIWSGVRNWDANTCFKLELIF